MDLKNQRLWYVVAAVIVVLLVIGYGTGWLGGTSAPESPVQQTPTDESSVGKDAQQEENAPEQQ